ncbi:alpha/beta fold hydrolase [Amnibacterium sp. CER49]|uniref:alpha/beta fold hydrolase n=1 Tax=Amnibacterium sp. CER49 TaxID=3039161 RepID=UPI002446AFB3|nr:alpha/beta fold hydrolase [Amnibacterium sp. CER49]MDH2442766.1 alpha/beta fold hydrolase [Amnibacterium sp. CER49]
MADRLIAAPSGRRLGLSTAGDPQADRLVLLCHPTPGSASFDPNPGVTERWGVHVVSLDRPGYGSSEPLPADTLPSLKDRVEDVAGYLRQATRSAETHTDDRDFVRLGVVGWGTGAAVALAFAATYGDRVDRLALVGAPAKRGLRKLARRALIAPRSPAALHVTDDDPDLALPGLRGRLQRMVDDAFLQGKVGIDTDRVLMSDDFWVKRMGSVEAETVVLVGDRDPVADEDDAAWYAKRLPHATVEVAVGSGPLAIATQWERILAHVAPNHGSLPAEVRDHGAPRLPQQ